MPVTTYESQKQEAQRIGQRVRWVRELLGITPTQLGADVGVDASLIRHIERGVRLPSIHVLMSLCHVCRVSPQYLLWGSLEAVDLELAGQLKQLHPELQWPAERGAAAHTDKASQNTYPRPTTRARYYAATPT